MNTKHLLVFVLGCLLLVVGVLSVPGPPTVYAADCADLTGEITADTTVDLTGNCDLGGEVEISANVTINGNGYTIAAAASSRIFFVNSGYSLTINNATLNGGSHSSGTGGAIFNQGETIVTNVTLSGNSTSNGGAIGNWGGTLTVTGSTFSGNSATTNDGGAIYNTNGGAVNVTNSTFYDNTAGVEAGDEGGAIFSADGTGSSTVNVTNSTFSGNSAGGDGDTFYIFSGAFNATNNIVAGSAPGNCSGTITSVTGANLSTDDTCTGFTEVTSGDLNLGSLADNGGPTQTIALLSGSVAIDHPDATCATATDQRGITRPQGTGCDAGAFEVEVETEDGSEASNLIAPECGDLCACDSIWFVGGWGIYVQGTPAETAFTVPVPPAGYSYVASPAYKGWCDVFAVNDVHSPLPVQVCWPTVNADVVVGLYHDLPDLTRTWSVLPAAYDGISVCASLPQLGSVALLTGGSVNGMLAESPQTLTNETPTPVNCQVTTTHAVIFRDSPGGADIGRIVYDATLKATAEADGWYQVVWLGETGWISGDYVTAVCE
jgi:hypothetical protein